jgi:hypothetical protein
MSHLSTIDQFIDMDATTNRQSLLHDATITLSAPVQVWSRHDGSMGSAVVDGVYLADTRVLDQCSITVGGELGEHIATIRDDARRTRFVRLHRSLDATGADPDVLCEVGFEVAGNALEVTVDVKSRLPQDLETTVVIDLRTDATRMGTIKEGAEHPGVNVVEPTRTEGGATWRAEDVTARLSASGGTVGGAGRHIVVTWPVRVSAVRGNRVSATIELEDDAPVVVAASGPAPWNAPRLVEVEGRLATWTKYALEDLDALRMVRAGRTDEFLAAGAPWFFTLFGRDAIWAARLLLPLGTELAASTLRVLAELQGRGHDIATEEQPGKIPHELRRAGISVRTGDFLPPLYYGTIDATPLWICLLHDAWRGGMPEAEVRELLPALQGALEWMRDAGDRDGDGLLEYINESGSGLSNQGWKDSGDSVQWADGRLARGPLALCEVQAYAYEAAISGAAILDTFNGTGAGDSWRSWASRLRAAFRDQFWVDSTEGRFPAIALDADKLPVDSLTSNVGHLLGTGLLDHHEEAAIAALLVSPSLRSGFGVRTMSKRSAGYWPLSYHGGSVWAHDTAIAVRGLSKAGFDDEAKLLASELVDAAAGFGYRMPELHGGQGVSETSSPIPYPAACRPQAWSAAASLTVLGVLRPEAFDRNPDHANR